MAPIKALCNERYQDWTKKFSPFGLNCTELTGDTDIEDFQALQRSHIVFTTPVMNQLFVYFTWNFCPFKALLKSFFLSFFTEIDKF